MIPAVCSICADYFESDQTCVSCPCGHVFHEHCLLQWLETSTTCPQCRRHTTSRKLIKLYFEVQPPEDGHLDAASLKNEVGTLEVDICRKKKEISDLIAENAHNSDRVVTLNKNNKKILKKLSDEQSTNEALKKQLDLMSYRMDEAKEAKRETKRLREKLKFLERFELVMSMNADVVDNMLREFGEGPKSARELATYCASLKREFENIKDSRKQLKEENSSLRKDLNQKTRVLEVKSKDLEAVQHSLVSLQDDVQSLEKEKKELRERYEMLQAALNSPMDGAMSSSLKQVFTPSNMTKRPRLSGPDGDDDDSILLAAPGDPQTPDLSLPSPSLETRNTCKDLGIRFVKTTSLAAKMKRPENMVSESAVWKNTLASSSLFNKRRALSGRNEGSLRKGYDGMGGHDRFSEVDPIIIRPNMKKVPRGVKRKPSGKPCTHALPTLDRFLPS
ncbi:E3 ubiquitin-protein ligase TRAIP [Strongylocentrotus purpuratus]|uniref:RING-type domain-containing protein n=1 Tax=Strongylocentrotus purpuratus TaxID=7668 RepID=A0A7M7NXA1_STRPU|nr:E3 ubiquitin-protein ligase TRAIP [Strongylocentrotus purpuratus]